MQKFFLNPNGKENELPTSALELLIAGDGTDTPIFFCEKNVCPDNTASCTDNVCDQHHGGGCGVNRCKIHIKL